MSASIIFKTFVYSNPPHKIALTMIYIGVAMFSHEDFYVYTVFFAAC